MEDLILEKVKTELKASQKDLWVVLTSNLPFSKKAREEKLTLCAALDDMAQIIGQKVETVSYDSAAILRALKKSAACFVEGHYTLSIGRTKFEAQVAAEQLEKSAEIYYKARKLGGVKNISVFEARLMRFVYKKKYSKPELEKKKIEEAKALSSENKGTEKRKCSDISKEEYDIREKLVAFGKKAVSDGLVQGTWGNFSIRLDEKRFLCTPSGRDYMTLTPEEMVIVNIDSLEYEGDLKPTSEKGLHGAIYKRRSDVGAIVHAHSMYASVFAAARKPMPVVIAEGQAVFGKEIPLGEYGLPGTKKLTKKTSLAMGENFGCIMTSHGMITAGVNMENAFANAMLLEECGKACLE